MDDWLSRAHVHSATAGIIDITGNSGITYSGVEDSVSDNLIATDRAFTLGGGDVPASTRLVDAPGEAMTLDSSFSHTVTFPNPHGSLTISGGTGDDTIWISSVDQEFGGALTINGGAGNDMVMLHADMTFARDNDLNIDLQDDEASPGVDTVDIGANLIAEGTGAIVVKASRNVWIRSHASLVTALAT